MDRNKQKKEEFLKYYTDLPNQKLAAGWVGVDQDTIINWKKADPEFSDAVGKAKSQFALIKSKRVRSQEWLLERILKDEFAERKEVTGAESGPLIVEVIKPKKKNYQDNE